MKTGEIIGDLADKAGINLRQLAIKADIPYNTLYAIVKRKSERIEPETLRRIATALEVSLLDLLVENAPDNRRFMEREARRTGKSIAEIEAETVQDILNEQSTLRLLSALEASDPAIIQVFSDIPDRDIMIHLNSIVTDELTRDGMILTLKRAYELSQTPGYGRFAAPAPEGTDTTPPPDGSEGPQEGG